MPGLRNPDLSASRCFGSALFNISILLTQEADITRAMAESYRTLLDRFY